MNILMHLCFTYDNYRCNSCVNSSYSNNRVSFKEKTRLNKKDNRPTTLTKFAVIF